MENLKKKLLVIGGTGFIGTNLLRKADKLNFETYSLSTKEPPDTNYIKNTKYLFLDTRKKNNLEKIFENKFQYIVNLAGYIDHRSIIDGGFPIITEQINLIHNLISAIRNKGLIKFVQIGSSDEYGMNKSPINEATRENPITPYSLARVFNTQYLQMLNLTENLPIVILRLFLVYGPHQKFDRLVPQVINACLNNKIIDLSDGNWFRISQI
jgi:nucleoside-diphosphate-sugar epimerase